MKKKTAPTSFDQLKIQYLPTGILVPDPRNARKHPKSQLVKLKAGISRFGFIVPIVVDEANKLIAGHARLQCAIDAGMNEVPCVRVTHLTEAEKMALAIADNRLAEIAEWDDPQLLQNLSELCDIDFDVELTGFASAEIDFRIEQGEAISAAADPADAVPELDETDPAITRDGDLWQLGKHRVLLGSSLEASSFELLLGDDRANLIISDSPYNVSINGHVSGLGKTKHREFAMASGEMSEPEFTDFLTTTMALQARFSVDGSLHYQFMDWRHMGEMLAAGKVAYSELKALLVWNKTNGGMGSLYRSKHELIFLFKKGSAPHTNNINLGRDGRYRANVLDYPSPSSSVAGTPATRRPIGSVFEVRLDFAQDADELIIWCEEQG